MFDSLRPCGLYSLWNSPGQNTGVGSFSLLQEIFPTQVLNPSLPHCRQILYQLSQKGSPKVKVAQLCLTLCDPMDHMVCGILQARVGSLSLLQGSSQSRDWTQVSHIAGRFFSRWATKKAPKLTILQWKKKIMVSANRDSFTSSFPTAFLFFFLPNCSV